VALSYIKFDLISCSFADGLLSDCQSWEREKGHQEKNAEVERKIQDIVVPGFSAV
jgi:hypothetical protein